jgi:RNA polymerase sigma-70 factor (ECF subfamily)
MMLESLLGEYGDRVYRFVKRLVGPSWAEDLTQETFLRVLKSEYKGGRKDAWLFSIAHGVCVDHLRRRKVEREKLRLVPAAESYETGSDIVELLADLPFEQRQVFLLREEAQMSFKEIAELLDCPIGTVLARMHYAIDKLKKKLVLEEKPHDVR